MSETIRIEKQDADFWKSQDGRVAIYHDHTFETECDGPHPVKQRLDVIRRRFATDADFQRYIDKMKRSEGAKVIARRTKSDGWVEYLTWQCYGGEIHNYSQYTAEVDGDWTDDVYDTLTGAMSAVARVTGARVVNGRPAKPRTERATAVNELTGAAVWVACGHRAELDVNEDCYTCHNSVEVAV